MERATGLKRSTLRNILKRDRIGPKSARLIADALDISAPWLESGFGPLEVGELGPVAFASEPDLSSAGFCLVRKAQTRFQQVEEYSRKKALPEIITLFGNNG